MWSKENEINLITKLAKNEQTISQLYQAYAEKFPDYQKFWANLSSEEIEHSNWISDLNSKVNQGLISFSEERFKIEAIETFLKYLQQRLADIKEEKISLINALSIALDIENSLIERKFFEVFESDSEGLKYTLLSLAAATEFHRTKIKKILDEIRNK